VRELDVRTSVKRATLVGLAALMVGGCVAVHRREATDTETSERPGIDVTHTWSLLTARGACA
jgi:hypothetical protein